MTHGNLNRFCTRLLAVVTLLAAGIASAAQPLVESLILVNTTRVGRTTYDYTYQIVLSNPDLPRTGVTATVTSISPYTVIMQGTVAAGDMAAGTRITPSGTITIRQDRLYPFNRAALRWTIGGQLTSGLAHLTSNGVQRDYYLKLPSDYNLTNDTRPVVMAFHGTTGSYQNWTQGYYNLQSVVGDGAVLVYPQALVQGNGITQWSFTYDFQFFTDIVAELNSKVRYNHNKLFVTGHSSGGGITHEIGCRYGDVVRAIAPVAGALLSTSCTGAVAVIQIQGKRDSYAPLAVTAPAYRFWVKYNGFSVTSTPIPGVTPPCVNYALGQSDYPMQWCLHDEGIDGPAAHAWPSFASSAIWSFFSGLSEVPPGPNPPPGGGNSKVATVADTTYTFTAYFPPGMPQPLQAALSLYAAGQQQPIFTAPIAFLNQGFLTDGAVGGDTRTYTIPVKYQNFGDVVTFPGSYAFSLVVYVNGGSYPIPTTGVDYTALQDIYIPDTTTPIIVPGTLTLEPVQSF